ncbi:response regulator transcription factor [Actinomycetospora corticicola]|uniref:Two-component system nitrate/nitrite response regulator NarL n=1 Tax=Actinomycetospora corticicola TaxID=663602 RepID=A0A7Y9DT89_9PSEU|nr:two-component system nitrate/nitrite response regulator NarL [Actinomycetospora corticicola]
MRDSREKITVVVADDHEMYRDGVVRALVGSGWIDVVGEADDGEAAFAAIVEHRPDVALVDHRMPGIDGTEIVRRAARDGLTTRIVVLSAFTDPNLVYGALEEGAAGYLPKETRRRELVEAVRKAADGGTVLPAELAAGLAGEIRHRRSDRGPVLSERETEILRLMAQGLTTPAIAKQLFVAPSTVKTHVQRMYEKLEVTERAAAVAEAMRRGLLE